jgi:hypothetical protein
LVGYLAQEGLVGKIIVIVGVVPNIEKSVLAIPEWLMQLKIEAN